MKRAERERIAAEVKAGLRDAEARARRSAEQIADMRKATAGSTHPDAIRVQKLLALADQAPTHAERAACLRSAWDYTKDYVNRGPASGRAEIARQKQQEAAIWQNKIFHKVERLLGAKGMTDNTIASRTYIATGQKMDTVRKFVAERRAARLKK